MGACCNAKESKYENKAEEIYTKSARSQYITDNITNIVPKIELEVEKSKMNEHLTEIIYKYSNSFDNIIVKKFCMEQLWNVCRFYLDDYTNSEYILNDIRDKTKKIENFLKKFKIINYSIDELKMLSESSVSKFKKFADYKNIIMITTEEEIKIAQDFIEFFISKKINSKIYLFDNNLNESDLAIKNKLLYDYLDKKNFRDFPYIMLPLKFFPHLKSDNFIFIDYFTSLDDKQSNNLKFTKTFLSDPKNKETNIVKFFNHSKMYTIVQILSENKIGHVDLEMAEFKVPNKTHNSNCKLIILSCLNSIIEINSKRDTILKLIDIIKFDVLSDISVMIQIDNSIEPEVLIYFIYLFVWKVTDIHPTKLKNYISENFIFIKGIKEYTQNNFQKIEELLKEQYNYNSNEENVMIHIRRQTTNLEDLKLIKEKFDYHLKRLKRDVSLTEYNQICSTLEKILVNVIENPGNEKFYKIKSDSQHFKKFILVNEHALKIFESFGFQKKEIEGHSFYCLNLDISITYIKGISFDFSDVCKKYTHYF